MIGNICKKKILIVVAHPDDESFGMGGTIAKHILNNDLVFAISMTNGVSSRNDISQADIEKRTISSKKASDILGFKWFNKGDFPDNALDTIPILEIIKFIENIKEKINPDLIYTHCSSDLNIDHRIVSQSTLTAFRPQANEKWVEIRTFEVPSSTDYGHSSITGSFKPNLIINIENTWHLKEKALNSYKEELKEYPNSRSIEGIKNLAKLRGSQVGLFYAEAFEMIRRIER